MKKEFTLKLLKYALGLVLLFGALSCTEESIDLNSVLNDEVVSNVSSERKVNSTSAVGDYNVSCVVTENGSLWTYTITKSNAKAKNLSHFIIDLNNCGSESATFANIQWATTNGSPADLSPTEGSGTGCSPQSSTTNFIKINVPAATTLVIVIKFERGYEKFINATAWFKAGTSCNVGLVDAPGCPIEDYCTYSQGYFFGNGANNNGASAFWTNGLVVGGYTYNQVNGDYIWNIDKGPGGDSTLNAFFQLGAVRLSGVENYVDGGAAAAAIIDAYFTGITGGILATETIGNNGQNSYQYFNLPSSSGGYTKAQVVAAGQVFAAYVETNHCP